MSQIQQCGCVSIHKIVYIEACFELFSTANMLLTTSKDLIIMYSGYLFMNVFANG